jgi:hypothetical protein
MGSVRRAAVSATSLIAVAVAFVLVAPAALGATPSTDIHSAGQLSDIYIGNDLSCQVRSGGFSSTEFFPNAAGPGDCGSFFNTGSDTAANELLGPDFQNHAGGTNTTGNFPVPPGETPYTPVSQSMTGSGTAASPYRVTTVVTANDPFPGNPDLVFQLTEVDTYVVGQNFYRTDVTVKNVSSVDQNSQGAFYHVVDCQLRGSDTGFGAQQPNANTPTNAACTPNVLGNPASALEELVPITPNATWRQTTVPTIWSELNGSAFLDDCLACRGTAMDNALGLEWSVPALAAGASQTFSFSTVVMDTVPTGGFSFAGPTGSTVGGTVATIADPDTNAASSAYSATISWGDGTSTPGTVTGGNGAFNVAGNHAYSAGGSYPIAVTIASVGTSLGSSTVNDSATITSPPTPVLTGAPPSVGGTTAAFTGQANPGGLATTAFFQYGLDPKYTGGGPINYNQSTPAQAVGSDFATHIVTASVTGLVPNATYHVRLVATNSAGTTFGPDVAFNTLKTAPPPPPTLGKTFNVSLINGIVLIKIGGVFIPLTEVRQIPANTVIDALHGTLTLTIAAPPGAVHDAAAKGKKTKVKTQTGTFGGAVFKLTQAIRGAGKGVANLALVEGAFTGAPTYATCKKKGKAADATTTALSTKALQLLHANAHGKFRTTGRYSAATVRGTKWTIADRCDGTLTRDITDSVAVTDFVHQKTIILHAGQHYLAKKP